ncbi:DUF1853 family protein [Halomonas binhaiensis]|uniref:DUF1853 family protein n=1 Tax=Halomonas binhaiensis TaxID=2562282 RepID=A0A5C1NG81_9GAMM|nr:DUF1853 family protein [Halomonas binhaiensis]
MSPCHLFSPASNRPPLVHPLVRDLAWLIGAPDLVNTTWPGRPTRHDLGLEDPGVLASYLARVERHPESLEQHTGKAAFTRLGQYHERLWQFLLDTAPATTLLAHNIPVRADRRTLGELDLVYRKHDGTVVHLEVAVKFFLGLIHGPRSPNDMARWIGPGGLDSLSLKVHHLLHHQLPLTQTKEARQVLNDVLSELPGAAPATRNALATSCPEVQLAMPGVLFSPWNHPLPVPDELNPDAYQGLWCHWSDWSRLCSELDEMRFGTCLAKPHWLAPPLPPHWMSRTSLSRTLAAHFATYATPLQLMLCAEPQYFSDLPFTLQCHADEKNKDAPSKYAGRRVFVVGDDWPRQIPLPPLA